MTRSLSLVEIVRRQESMELWFIFPGLVAFFIYFVSGVAETNRNPFDLPEAESELVSGFNTEYSGVKFAFFFLGEYTSMIIISCVAVTVFLGGWLQPFPNVAALKFLGIVPPAVWFLAKVSAFIFCYIWFRSTFPRYRFDQLMALGWKWLIPLALTNIVVTAFAILAHPRTNDRPRVAGVDLRLALRGDVLSLEAPAEARAARAPGRRAAPGGGLIRWL